MATLVNIRIHTQSKAVPNAYDITIEEVSLIGNTIIAKDDEGVAYELGVISAENIVVETPPAVSDCGSTTTNANIFATLVKGVDGVTPDMSDYYNKEVIEEKLATKQDVVRDIETIRDGAAKGATALQSVPSEYVTERELQERGYATRREVESKQDVISDLDAIRQGASKGATALQTETYTGTVTGVKVNGVTHSPNKGVVDVGDVITSHQPLKTINGESIVGEGNIVIEGGGGGDLDGYATEEYVNNAVEAVNVKGEDGYVYSNGEKVDMRIRRSLIPIGTLIPANADLKTIAYLKVGNYYCSQTSNASTIKNCPVEVAFSMEVFNPLSENLDDETTAQYTYRIRKITAYNTGVQYIQYCNTSGTAGTWTYGSWYVVPRTSFSLASDKNGGSAVKGGSTRGVYIDASGTFQQMGYTIATSVPKNAVFTDTNTKVTAVGNHYAPVEDESVVIEAPAGEVVIGLKRDAKGHVVGIKSTPMSGGGGGGGGIAVETDPIFSASPAASITEDDIRGWNNDHAVIEDLNIDVAQLIQDVKDKQDAISDLETIRSNASKGATAVQPESIKNVAKLDEGYVIANGIVSEEDVYYHLPNTNTSDAAHTLATKGDLSSTIETYVADFTMESLINGMNNGSHVNCDMQALVTAMNANKIILVRECADSSYQGVYVLNGYAEDLLYFSIVDTSGNVLYCDGTDYVYNKSYIDGRALFYRSWDDKQDALVSGENIKTINGESIVGSGDMLVSKITYFSEGDIIELSPNVVWMRRGSVVNSLQITGFASNGKDYEEYAYHFYTGTIADGSAVKLILPEGVKYANKEIFDALESDTHYELSVVRSNGVVKAVLTAFK